MPDPLDFDSIAHAFSKSKHRLVIVGLVGTLIPDLCALAAERRDTRYRTTFPTLPQQHQAVHNHESKAPHFTAQQQQPLTPSQLPPASAAGSGGAAGSNTSAISSKLTHSTSFPSGGAASNAVASAIANLPPLAGSGGASSGGNGSVFQAMNPSPSASPAHIDDSQSLAKPNPAVLALIRKLANDPNTTVTTRHP